MRQTLRDAAVESVQRYLDEHGSTLDKTVHSEKEAVGFIQAIIEAIDGIVV